MRRFTKPIIVVSQCLGFDACRYDGDMVDFPLAPALKRWMHVVTVCPEAAIGLGIPRAPIQLCKLPSGGVTLYQPATGRRLTKPMRSFARSFGDSLDEVDGFLLKSKSPSCGLGTTKLFDSISPDARVVGRTSGLFAEQIQRRFTHLPMTDERRLLDLRHRETWLTAVFTLAQFRRTATYESARSLARFHSYHRSLIAAYNASLCRKLDRVVENSGTDLASSFTDNRKMLLKTFAKPARRSSLVRALDPAIEHYRPYLTRQNLGRYDQLCDQFLGGHVQLAELRKLIQIWAVRYDKSFVRRHALFRPYPNDLAFL